jgi:hypothetical protein
MLLRFVNQRQTLLPRTGAVEQRVSHPVLQRADKLAHGGRRYAPWAAPVKLPCRAVASKACNHFSRFSDRITGILIHCFFQYTSARKIFFPVSQFLLSRQPGFRMAFSFHTMKSSAFH